MKICIKCGLLKELSYFPTRVGAKDGHRNECKVCKSLRDAEKHQIRINLPGMREKERTRQKLAYDNRSADEREKQSNYHAERFKEKQEIAAKLFFDEHGCSKKELKLKEDQADFIARSIGRNGTHYCYNKVKYLGATHKVIIHCNKHDVDFEQTPKTHDRGSGCVLCANEATGNALRKSQEEFIKQAEDLYGDKYTFENSKYVSNLAPLDVNCKAHGSFMIRPGNLFSGRGCPSCAKHGYRANLPGHFYILAKDNITKVGITNRTPELRIKDINKSNPGFEVVYSNYYEDGEIPLAIETSLLWTLPLEHKRVSEKFDGSTECFLDVDREYLIYIAKNSGAIMEGTYGN